MNSICDLYWPKKRSYSITKCLNYYILFIIIYRIGSIKEKFNFTGFIAKIPWGRLKMQSCWNLWFFWPKRKCISRLKLSPDIRCRWSFCYKITPQECQNLRSISDWTYIVIKGRSLMTSLLSGGTGSKIIWGIFTLLPKLARRHLWTLPKRKKQIKMFKSEKFEDKQYLFYFFQVWFFSVWLFFKMKKIPICFYSRKFSCSYFWRQHYKLKLDWKR
jgi:hypothetical protein